MRRCVSRCVLLALLAAFFAVPATAGTIVGEFYFQRDQPFEYFTLTNTVDPVDALGGLKFSGLIQIDGFDYDEQFIDPAPIGSGESAMTLGLPATPPFAAGGKASLVFNSTNVGNYFGTLSLSNLLEDDVAAPTFSAQVVFTPNAVPEAPSWLVVVIALGALAVGRHFLA